VAKLLLSRGADVNAADKPWGGTALGAASARGHLEMVDFLISRGA
jgi:ankyrin repeat protein